MGKFKFFWTGCEEGTAGVGFLVAERWVEKVLEVKPVSARLMLLIVPTFPVPILNLILSSFLWSTFLPGKKAALNPGPIVLIFALPCPCNDNAVSFLTRRIRTGEFFEIV